MHETSKFSYYIINFDIFYLKLTN